MEGVSEEEPRETPRDEAVPQNRSFPSDFYEEKYDISTPPPHTYELTQKYLASCLTDPATSSSICYIVDGIRALAPSGYSNAYTRARVWPLLLGISTDDIDINFPYFISEDHKYYDQVQKDVARSCCHHDVHKNLPAEEVSRLRVRLGRLLHALFSKHEGLHYVQGFHDVATVIMTVCGDDEALAFALIERLATVHLRDSLQPSLDRVVQLMSLVMPLVAQGDSALYLFLRDAELSSFFTLSWLLTWLSHNIVSISEVCRVFDFLLASHPLMPLYLCSALVLAHKDALLALPADMPTLLQYFQHCASAPVDSLLATALSLWLTCPPTVLLAEPVPELNQSDSDSLRAVTVAADSPLWLTHPVQLAPSLPPRHAPAEPPAPWGPAPTRMAYSPLLCAQLWPFTGGRPDRSPAPTTPLHARLPAPAAYQPLLADFSIPPSLRTYLRALHLPRRAHRYPVLPRLWFAFRLASCATLTSLAASSARFCGFLHRVVTTVCRPASRKWLALGAALRLRAGQLWSLAARAATDAISVAVRGSLPPSQPTSGSSLWNPHALGNDNVVAPLPVLPARVGVHAAKPAEAPRKGLLDLLLQPRVLFGVMVAVAAVAVGISRSLGR